jgi:flagellar biogenesis protein FliO
MVIAMVTESVPRARGQSVVADILTSLLIFLIPIGLILFTSWLFCRKQAANRASKATSSTDTSDC